MRNAILRWARLDAWRASKKRRRSRTAGPRPRRLFQEPLESRTLLSVSPQLVDLNPTGASSPSDFVQVGSVSYFVAGDATHGRELWKTDGFADGTELVKDVRAGTSSSDPHDLVDVNGTLFFVADDGTHGQQLWKSDGTANGTVLVTTAQSSDFDPQNLAAVGSTVYFTASNATSSRELWKSTGTSAGTAMVKDIDSGTASSDPQNLVAVGNVLFFSADDGSNGRELWKSDGTAAGTVLVKDIATGTHLDGGATVPNASDPQSLVNVGGTLFFTADDGTSGRELWKSSGTGAGTVQVKDILGGTLGGLDENTPLTNVDGTLFFAANNGTSGAELWKSDGTESGTVLVKDIFPGGNWTYGYSGNYSYDAYIPNESAPKDLTSVGGILFFSAADETNGRELWMTDGTAPGTVMVKDVYPGTTYDASTKTDVVNSSSPEHLTAVGARLFFSAADGAGGVELWTSDGTVSGTVQVADIRSGSDSSSPQALFNAGGTLLFSADDGAAGRELWTYSPELDYTTFDARLSIFVGGQLSALPANVGVYADQSTADVFTKDATGQLFVHATSLATLGDFFDTWRTDAGLAGNNPDAVLSANQLLDNLADTTSTVQMFVNGHVSTAFENYVLRDGDQIVLVYGSDPVVSLVTNFGPIVVELYEGATPITVNNFLNYVNSGAYVNSFFHRSVQGPSPIIFVIQGGGFTTNSTTLADATIGQVSAKTPIANESALSNFRGTISMARTSDLNSATSQFFINNGDNLALDPSSQDSHDGYAVFGQVLDITTVDAIAALPIDTSNAAPFGELPLSSSGELAVIQSVEGLGELTGVKFLDQNSNGARDDGEPGVAGITVYVDANENGALDAGELTATTDADGRFLMQVEPGTYVVRAALSPGRVTTAPTPSGAYSATVEIGRETAGLEFGEAGLDPPGNLDLLAGFDTGTANSDNLTRLNNSTADAQLQFQVSGVADGAEVRIYSDGVQIGSGTASGGEFVLVTTDGATTLADGAHNITATQTLAGVTSDPSAALAIIIDTVPPAAITNTAGEFAQIRELYTFDAESDDEGASGVTYSLVDAPAGMTITPDKGEINWTPTEDQAVPQLFQILLSDAAGNAASQTVDMTVLGDIPAYPDTYGTVEDTFLTVVDPAKSVLVNDGNEQSGTLEATLVSDAAHGHVALNADGTFTYTPNENFFGSDFFTYKASSNGVDFTNVAKAKITVNGQPDPPTAADDSLNASSDGTAQTLDVLANDSSAPDGDQALSITAVTQGTAGGTVAISDDGTKVLYTAPAGFAGNDTFTYTITDTDGLTDTATVTVAVASPADNVLSGFVYVDADGDGVRDADEMGVPGVLITLTGTDNADNAVTRTAITLNDGSYSFTELPSGTYVLAEQQPAAMSDGLDATTVPDATVDDDQLTGIVLSGGETYTENNFGEGGLRAPFISIRMFLASTPAPDVYLYELVAQAEEAAGNAELAAAIRAGSTTLDAAANHAPVAVVESYTTGVDNVLTKDAVSGVLANDVDQDGDPLTASLVTQAAYGSLTLNADGSFTYEPDAGFSGDDSFTYAASDGSLASNTATVSLTVGDANAAPVAGDDTYSVDEDATLDVAVTTGVLANDSDPNGDPLSAVMVDPVSHGTLLDLNADGSFTYTPVANYHGTDSFTYTVSDGQLTSAEATVTITVNPVNDPPVAVDDAYQMTASGQFVDVTSGVLVNDSDADGDSLVARLVEDAGHGVLFLGIDGSFTYTPDLDFHGTDTFTYSADDGTAQPAPATVTITVNPTIYAQLRLEVSDESGTPVETVVEGEQFLLSVYVQDVRLDPQGVAAAYLDVLYDSSLVSIAGPISFGPDYASGQNGNTETAGLIDEAGASSGGSTSLGGQERLLFQVPLRADAVGTAVFTADPADVSPDHDVLMVGDDAAVLPERIDFIEASVDITAALADQALAGEADWLAP